MPLHSRVVGRSGEPVTHEVDARWTMAYAAGLGDDQSLYLDTTARPDVLAHPVFPVCFEWPIFLSARHLPTSGLAPEEARRGVHATHDLMLHRPVRAGMRVTTTATLAAVEARKPGAYQLTRLESVDAQGRAVCTTWYGTIMRGVAVEGGDRSIDGKPPEPPGEITDSPSARESEIDIPANAAHVYTECARIWNPIHTDAAVAKAAGLPAIILHGTATLALAVSRVVAEAMDGDPERVARVAGRFSGMVRMPSVVRVRWEPVEGGVAFGVLGGDGSAVIRGGFVGLRG